MNALFWLVVMAIVSCGSPSGVKQALTFKSNLTSNLLRDGKSSILNCSGSLTKNSQIPRNQTFYFQLVIQDDTGKILNSGDVIYNYDIMSTVSKWISFKVQTEYLVPMKTYICKWKSNYTKSKLQRALSIVFATPPHSPTNITSMFIHDRLFILADSPYSKYVQKQLGTEYSLRLRGDNCYSNSVSTWREINSCKTTNRENKHFVVCIVNLKKIEVCTNYKVIVVVKNRVGLGKARSKVFHIRKGTPKPLLLNMKKMSVTTNQIAVQLESNMKATPYNEIQYNVRFWEKKQINKQFQQISSVASTITISKLTQITCYYITAKMVTNIYSTDDGLKSNWTLPRKYCTKGKIPTKIPVDFKCNEMSKLHSGNPSVVKLSWMNPNLNERVYGQIKFYNLSITYKSLNKSWTRNVTIDAGNTINHTLYSRRPSYVYGRFLVFKLKICTEHGCSSNSSYCDLIYKERKTPTLSTFNLSKLLSCVIPVVVILFLVLGAFWSYYRKKEILTELEQPLTFENKSDSDDQPCPPSEEKITFFLNQSESCDSPKVKPKKQPISQDMMNFSGSRKNSRHVEDNVMAVDDSLNSLFVNTGGLENKT